MKSIPQTIGESDNRALSSKVNNPRIYGSPPYKIAVIHGGPGAPGTMAPVAQELAKQWGVLEPLQTSDSLEGQVQELYTILDQHGDPPMTLIGSSWGAMLAFILTARHPQPIKKLILVGSGVYEERFAPGILETRLNRLENRERQHALSLMESLDNPAVEDKSAILARLGEIFTRTDAYDPITLDTKALDVQYDVHQRVWEDAIQLRRSGELMALGRRIHCPVVAIHGDYDPHPASGIQEPLSSVLTDFRFILLQNCGHLPWIEVQARAKFYAILEEELRSG
jgi:pimeloyl-ACP methyl ester carboxylesterase